MLYEASMVAFACTRQVRATESQLEFAHKQLDVRQQELRGAADASTAAKRSGEQLAAEVETLKEELTASRREIDAGTLQVRIPSVL